MADDDGAAPATPAEKAGEAVKAVETEKEAIKAGADDAVARAQAEADAANDESKRIAAAALQTTLGQEIEKRHSEFTTWRTTAEQREAERAAQIASLQKDQADLKTGLGLLLGSLKPASPSPSTPPKSEAPPADPPTKDPENAGGQQSPPPPPAVPSRKRHLL